MTKKHYIVSCPFCGCKVINEVNSGVIHYRVTEWIVEDHGYVYPDNRAPGEWQSEMDCEVFSPAYECNDCYKEFDQPHIEDVEDIMKRSKSNE